MSAPTPLDLRRRWKRVAAEPAVLRVAVLATYTADPLVPYLGGYLHEAGLPASVHVGPVNQIAQQCLDDGGPTARVRPDVLVALPRLEDLAAADPTAGLSELAGIARSAAARWNADLLLVLPAVPEDAPLGVGEFTAPAGGYARAAAAREALRAQASPGVLLADAEAALRTVGATRAHHPALLRFAQIPYTEEVFAELGRQIAAVLRVRFGGAVRAAVLDADSLFTVPGAQMLAEPLAAMAEAGVRIAVRGTGHLVDRWDALAGALGPYWLARVADWAVDDRPAGAQLADLAAYLDVAPQHLVLVSAGPVAGTGATRVVDIGADPDRWPALLGAGAILDRLPVPGATAAPAAAPAPPDTGSLDRYVAGLLVAVDWLPPDERGARQAAEMVVRTKEFTLGIGRDESDLAGRGGDLVLADVRDRLGRYGTSVAVGLTYEGDTCVPDVFLVSCPVLGKGVEDAVLGEVVERADRAGARTVAFGYRETGRNQPAVEFLTRAAARTWTAASGRAVRVLARPVPEGGTP